MFPHFQNSTGRPLCQIRQRKRSCYHICRVCRPFIRSIRKQIGGEFVEALASRNGSSNIKPEKRIPDTAVPVSEEDG